MRLWQASPREDCPSLFSLSYDFYSDAIWICLQAFRKDGSEQRSFSVCHHVPCCKFVSGISEENTHLQPLSSTFPKRVSLWLHLKIYIFFPWQRPLWGFFLLPFYIFFNLRLFAQPYLETNSHLHLYRKMHCMEGNLYFLQIFLIQFWWVLQRRASSYCCDCCFVFLFVIRMRDDSGWCMWEAQLGGKDAITYS